MPMSPHGYQDAWDGAFAWQAMLLGDDVDWEQYIFWLEADARHREAFDSLSLLTKIIEEHRIDVGSLLIARILAERWRILFW